MYDMNSFLGEKIIKVLKCLLQLQCCGIEGPKDWDRNNYFNCSSRDVGSREACGVPFSCCKRKPNVSTHFKIIIREFLHTSEENCMFPLILVMSDNTVWCHASSTHGCQHCMKVTNYHSHTSMGLVISLVSYISLFYIGIFLRVHILNGLRIF
jgi:hypothetical protein